MSGDVLHYTCRAYGGRAKYLTQIEKMKTHVLNHLQLDPNNYIVKFVHDDDEERLQLEHNQRVEKWIASGKDISDDSKILPGCYEYSALQSFKDQRDRNRYYENGQIVRAVVVEFNLKKCWEELDDD